MVDLNPNQIPSEVQQVLDTLQSNGYPSYLVGGCVRDLLLGKVPKDFDICTKARPGEIKSLFKKAVETGIKYGTVTVLSEKLPVEVTTFRKTVTYTGGPRASGIEFGDTAEEDVQKRDFTINGLLYDGQKIIDYVNGRADLETGMIRAIESADQRFQEDALRMMRASRFCCQFDFDMEERTQISIEENAQFIKGVSPERIRDEMVKVLLSDHPARGFRLFRDTGLLPYFLPELQACVGFNQRNPHHLYDVFEHIMSVLEKSPKVLQVRLAALWHDIGKPPTFSLDKDGVGHFYGHNLKSFDMAVKIMNRLKFDHKTTAAVTALVREHMSRYESPRKVTLKKLINRVGANNIDDLIRLQIADVKSSDPSNSTEYIEKQQERIRQIIDEKEPLNFKDLAVNGNDLKKLGLEPGVKMGQLLNYLMGRVLSDPALNTRERLLELAKEVWD